MEMNVNDLTESLSIILPGLSVTKADLLQPKSAKVESIYYSLLIEFGVKEKFNLCSLDGFPENLESHGSLVLLGVLSKFFQDLGYAEPIGILDLYNPEPKRLRRFLSFLVNAWNFCNMNCEEAGQCLERVQAMERELNSLQRQVRELQSTSDARLRSQADEERVLQELRETLRECTASIDALNQEVEVTEADKEELRVDLAETQEALAEAKARSEEQAKRRQRIRDVLHSEEVMEELRQHIEKLKGETNSKRRAEREKREALAKLKDKIQEIEAYSKQLDPVKQKHTRVEKKQGELKQVLWEKPSATEAVEELSQGVEALRKTNMELRRQGAVSDGKRAKHKAQMKNELTMLENELATAAKGQSEEEKKFADINRNIQENQMKLDDLGQQKQRLSDLLENEEAKIVEVTERKIKKIFQDIKNMS